MAHVVFMKNHLAICFLRVMAFDPDIIRYNIERTTPK